MLTSCRPEMDELLFQTKNDGHAWSETTIHRFHVNRKLTFCTFARHTKVWICPPYVTNSFLDDNSNFSYLKKFLTDFREIFFHHLCRQQECPEEV